MDAIHRIMLPALVLAALGCYSNREIQRSELTTHRLREASYVTLTVYGGRRIEIHDASLEDSTIVGFLDSERRQPTRIALADVTLVEVSRLSAGKTALAVVGGIAGTLAAVAIIVALTKESCPFIYAQDSTGFALQGELYSGAVMPALQRRDFLAIRHLAPLHGLYTLRLSDEARETQYTDELRLLAIDHPAGVEVLPDEAGGLHTVSGAIPPVTARDYLGNDVLRMVAAADTASWTADPFGRDPADPAQLRDGVVVSFPAPRPGAPARLVVRIRNTAWADYAFGRYLGLMGSAMQGWFASQQGEDARLRAERFTRSQGLSLGVAVRDARGWHDVAAFHPTGPIAWQDEVLPLTGTASIGDTLTVRLDGGAVLWSIDRIALDTTPELPLSVQVLTPTKAVADDGKDATGLLTATDGRYQVLPEAGRTVTVAYVAPPPSPGLVRSFVVRADGYYTIHQRSTASPDYASLASIQQDPNGFLRFSLRELWRLSHHEPGTPQGGRP